MLLAGEETIARIRLLATSTRVPYRSLFSSLFPSSLHDLSNSLSLVLQLSPALAPPTIRECVILGHFWSIANLSTSASEIAMAGAYVAIRLPRRRDGITPVAKMPHGGRNRFCLAAPPDVSEPQLSGELICI